MDGGTKVSSNGVNGVLIDREKIGERFDISEEFGFASDCPLTDLPDYFKPWTDIAFNIEQLVKEKKLRSKVKALPLLEHSKLTTKAEWEVAHMFLAYISQGYVWQEGEQGVPEVLPKNIAIPFHAVSQHLGIPANLNQFNGVLVNWKLRDSHKPCELENLDTIVRLMGGEDETWFFMTSLMVEKECGPALYAIVDAQQSVYYGDDKRLTVALAVMEGAILKMVKELNRMGDGLRPHAFYNVIRPFIAGWSAPAFKEKALDGLIYEGVSDKPFSFPGGTAADSSTLPSIDAALGILHKESEETLLEDFKKYMPPRHVEFIAAVAKGPSIRNYVLSKKGSEVLSVYNRCLDAVKLFRNTHLQLVTRFIVIPARESTQGQGKGVVGTGGTGFMKFLKGLRDSTVQAIIRKDLAADTPPASSIPKYMIIAAVVAISGVVCASLFQKYK